MTSNGTVLPLAKNVVVYKNGDPFFHGRKFVVNQRQILTFESFLNEVTHNIQAQAAVRNLYTPREGHRVRELDDLQNGSQYVAAGFEKFKKLDYLNPGAKKPAANRKSEGIQIRTVYRLNVSAKWRKTIQMPSVIHVFRNGDLLCPPFRLIVPRNALQDWEKILNMVTEKANLRTGAVRRLCTLEGETVSSGENLENGQYYVAVGAEKFKKLPYVELLVPKAPSHNLRNHPGNRRIRKKHEYRKPVSVPQDGYSDSALMDSPEQSDERRVRSTEDGLGNPVPSKAVRRKLGKTAKEEDTIFHARPVRVRKNRTNPQPPPPRHENEEAGVFKGNQKRREVQGAAEVAEDENTAVEFPVDQRVAETVEDEVIERDLRENKMSAQETKAHLFTENHSSEDHSKDQHNGRTSSASSRRQEA
ncbi:doublecortin domain-containing protein 2B isoform X2 [Amia ocellicauda]|uniref:doublecortin domain-containing protein 2B isoform X2 n=1 Tax=Amia ocellicauda TaxID=2972642 RepID=UPI0034647FA1